mmetsp:Transcript_66357/g.188419  ORF Transcript_66357/g.188419 Transcript_66357/m.188419 type:complete len:362 (-) Transcript_66357:66-1151(-)
MGVCAAKEEPTAVEVPPPVEEEDAEVLEVGPGPPGPKVVILGARGLREAEVFPGTERTCYCTLALAGSEDRLATTKEVKNALEPVWDHEAGVPGLDDSALEFVIWDADADGASELLGKATLEAARIREQEGFNGELELQEAGENVKAFLRVKISMPGKPFPPAPPKEFIVELENPKKKALGVEVEVQDGNMLYVTAVKNGPVQLYNKDAEPTKQLMPGDFIVKINDIEGDSKKLNAALKKKVASLSLVCRRAEEWRVVVDKGEDKSPVGVEFVKPPVGHSIVLTQVGGGAIEAWNQGSPEREVRPGDRILAIGGKRGKPDALLKQIKASTRFTMLIARPAEVEGKPSPKEEEPKPEGGAEQ